jgi:hypothetical protein
MSTTLFAMMAIVEETKASPRLRTLMVSRQHQEPLRSFYAMGVAVSILLEHFALKAALKPREEHWDTQFFPELTTVITHEGPIHQRTTLLTINIMMPELHL